MTTHTCADCKREFATQRGFRRHRCDSHDDCYGHLDRHADTSDRHAGGHGIHVRLNTADDPDLHGDAAHEATRRGVTLTELVRLAVRRMVKRG